MKKITFFHEHLINKCVVSKTRLLFMLLFVSSLSFAQLPTDAVAKYTFTNGSLVNIADAGNGDLSGGAVPTSLLRPNRFGNTNSAIRIEASSRSGYAFTGTNNNISVSFWMAGSVGSDTRRILQVYDGSGDGFHISTQSNTTMSIRFKNSGAVDLLAHQTSPPIFDGSWHHVVVTLSKTATGYDNNVYIDGALNTALSNINTTNTSDFLTSNATFIIAPDNKHYGNIDDIELFDRALTAAEVQSIYTHIPNLGMFYVNASATGNNDGTTWADAFTDLHTALAISNITDQVWVAKGTYKPHATDRNISFVVNTNLYGGFAGTEATLSERDMSLIHTTNETVFSGDLLGDDDATIDFNDTTRDDNSYHVVEVNANYITVDGVTIKDGNADATSGDNRFGGGLFKALTTSDFTIKNSVIKNNIAFTGAGLALATSTGTLNMTIDACIIENNLANGASGVDFHLSQYYGTMNLAVTNTLFKYNKTEDDAVKNRSGVGATAMRIRAYFDDVTLNADVVNNTFVDNESNGNGGGDYPVVEISKNNGDWGNINVANNIFWGNTENTSATAKAIGRTSVNSTRFGTTSSNRIVQNNTDEDGLSLISGASVTSTINPNFNANFELTTGSTAIDSGDNSLIPSGITGDLLFNQRIYNITVDRGAFEFGASSLGLNDFILNENEIKLYPNPSISELNIEMIQNLKQATIYSILGAEVLKTDSKSINTTNLKSGMYIIKIEDENGLVSTKRFLKN